MDQRADSIDAIAMSLFFDWQRLEQNALDVLRQSDDDLSNSDYVEAEKRSLEALWRFVSRPTSSIAAISLKLQVACHFEELVQEAIDPGSSLVAPRAIISALSDLQRMVGLNVQSTHCGTPMRTS